METLARGAKGASSARKSPRRGSSSSAASGRAGNDDEDEEDEGDGTWRAAGSDENRDRRQSQSPTPPEGRPKTPASHRAAARPSGGTRESRDDRRRDPQDEANPPEDWQALGYAATELALEPSSFDIATKGPKNRTSLRTVAGYVLAAGSALSATLTDAPARVVLRVCAPPTSRGSGSSSASASSSSSSSSSSFRAVAGAGASGALALAPSEVTSFLTAGLPRAIRLASQALSCDAAAPAITTDVTKFMEISDLKVRTRSLAVASLDPFTHMLLTFHPFALSPRNLHLSLLCFAAIWSAALCCT